MVADLIGKVDGETIAEIKALGAKCMFVPIDVSDIMSVKLAMLTTVAEFGRLDVAFNNKGNRNTHLRRKEKKRCEHLTLN